MIRMDKRMRREVADALWLKFGLMASHIGVSFEADGCTIRISFSEDVEFEDDVKLIAGVVRSLENYEEMKIQ